MLTHVHMLVYTLWCWHTLRRRWNDCENANTRAHVGAFEKMKCIFSIVPVGKLEKSREYFSLRNTHRTLAQKHRTMCLCVRCAGCLAQLGLGTGRRLERPVFWVRCPRVLHCSLGLSPVSTGRSGAQRPVPCAFCRPPWVLVRCAPDASGANLGASGAL